MEAFSGVAREGILDFRNKKQDRHGTAVHARGIHCQRSFPSTESSSVLTITTPTTPHA